MLGVFELEVLTCFCCLHSLTL